MSDRPDNAAVVLEGTGGVWRVLTTAGETREVTLAGRLKKGESERKATKRGGSARVAAVADFQKLAVGDEVLLASDEYGQSWRIDEIVPRRSSLTRREPGGGHGERVIAANVDQVVIVFAAAKPEPHLRMLDRFLVIAEANDLKARVVVNKCDLVPGGVDAARHRFAEYARIGYPLHLTSVIRDQGLTELRDALLGRTSVVTGPSGVGKSSLLNALYPGLGLRVGAVSESVNKGRHTTVGAFLHPLPGGGFVVDTPGLREVGTWAIPPEVLGECFPEVRAQASECRFADCAHRVEPGCAVREHLGSAVSAERYDSYLKLRDELEAEAATF